MVKDYQNFNPNQIELFSPLTGIPAVSDTLRTDGGCQIWTKLGQGGQYITLRYPDMKKTLLSPRGGILGDLIFLLRGY